MEAKTVKSNMTDMTQGSPAGLILFFALPLLVGNMFQQLYNMVDSIVVGRFVGSTALAAVGTAFPVVFLLSSMFMGLGIGAMVMVSQFYGAGDAERLKATIDTIVYRAHRRHRAALHRGHPCQSPHHRVAGGPGRHRGPVLDLHGHRAGRADRQPGV